MASKKKNAGELLRKKREELGMSVRGIEQLHSLAMGTWTRWELAGQDNGRCPTLFWALFLRDKYDVPVDAWPVERPKGGSAAAGGASTKKKRRKPRPTTTKDATPAASATEEGGIDEW